MVIEKVIIGIGLILTHLVNVSNFLNIGIWLKPDIIIIFIIFFSLKKGPLYGVWIGFFGGLLADISLGGELNELNEISYKIGLNALVFSILGYVAGKFMLSNYRENFLILGVYTFVLTCLSRAFVFYTYLYLFNENFSYNIFTTSLYNGVISPILFYCLELVYRVEMEKT